MRSSRPHQLIRAFDGLGLKVLQVLQLVLYICCIVSEVRKSMRALMINCKFSLSHFIYTEVTPLLAKDVLKLNLRNQQDLLLSLSLTHTHTQLSYSLCAVHLLYNSYTDLVLPSSNFTISSIHTQSSTDAIQQSIFQQLHLLTIAGSNKCGIGGLLKLWRSCQPNFVESWMGV